MLITSEIQLFQILKQKLGDKEAEALVTFVEAKLKESNDQNLKILATKEDIANSRADMIKWMFIFWLGSIGVISGIMITLFNAYIKH